MATRADASLSSFVQSLWSNPAAIAPAEPEEENEPIRLEREPLIEFPLLLPNDFDARQSSFQNLVLSLSVCQYPVVFELIGTPENVSVQLAVSAADQEHLQQQLQAFFPEVVAVPSQGKLEAAWAQAGPVAGVVEFGLARESVRLLAEPDHDVYVAMLGTFCELAANECGILQVIWQPVVEDWSESLVRSVTDSSGKAFFVNAPELADAAKRKTALPIYAAVVRLAACSGDLDRTWKILQKLATGFRSFSNLTGNSYDAHVVDFVRRQSRRPGMLLNAKELVGFVHLPSSAVRSNKFLRLLNKSKLAPASVTGPNELLLGINEHAGQRREVRLSAEQRVRHMHVVGATGTGKSTLLFNLIRQDIESGHGVGVIEPHGDLIDQILGVIPPERIKDVVLIDPSDEKFSVGFNILSAHSDWEKNLLAADLVSVFRRLSTSWGDQMDRVLANAILAFLESEKGGTLLDLRRFLIEPGFRERFLATVRDPEVVYYWRKGFALLSGNKSVGPVLTRLETFLAPKPIRYMVAQRENRIDFGEIIDSVKIFLAKLSQGALGRENSHLLGSLFVAKFQQLAMSRQRQAASQRRDFWLYVDEFQDFITPSMAEMLVGARKYRVGLVLAHQELRQVQRDVEVAGALSNAYTRVSFRVSDQDARTLANGLSFFGASDLQNLEKGHAVCRVERADFDFNLAVSMPPPEAADEAEARRDAVVHASRERYARPRSEIEAALRADLEVPEAPKVGNKPDIPRDTRPGTTVRPPTPTQTPLSVVEPQALASAAPGALWRDSQVARVLREPAVAGNYVYNTTRRVGDWKHEDKPEDQWCKLSVTPIISGDLWYQVSQILGQQEKKTARPGKAPVRLVGGLTVCTCGHRMYVPSGSRKYTCIKCKTKILADDLEAIFYDEMKRFFANPERIAKTFETAKKRVDEKESRLSSHRQEIEKVRDEMTRTHRLYLSEQIPLESFGKYHKPLEERLRQLQEEYARLEAEFAHIKIHDVSADQVLHEARHLYGRWLKMPIQEKRRVVQSIVERITIGKDKIEINFTQLTSSEEITKSQQLVWEPPKGSSWRPKEPPATPR